MSEPQREHWMTDDLERLRQSVRSFPQRDLEGWLAAIELPASPGGVWTMDEYIGRKQAPEAKILRAELKRRELMDPTGWFQITAGVIVVWAIGFIMGVSI